MNQYTATQVGSYFVDQYYKVFNGKRDHAHKFYTDESCILVIDGDIKRSVSKIEKIHEQIMSSKFMEVEIDTTNSLESLNGGVLVVVSGSLHSSDFTGSRKFVQTFFLAPQEQKGGYFVLNDVFHFMPNCIFHESTPECDNASKENSVESVSLVESVDEAVLSMESHVCLVEESDQLLQASSDSLDESDDLTSGDESEQQLEKTSADESDELKSPQLEKKTCADESDELKSPQLDQKTSSDESDEPKSPSKETKSTDCSMIFEMSDFPTLQELYAVARPVRDKLNHAIDNKLVQSSSEQTVETHTYACLVNGKSQPSIRNGVASMKEVTPTLPKFDLDAKEPRSGESNTVYVKNLSPTLTSLDVLYELKRFGKIKPDRVFLRNHQGSSSASFAFVEFQDARAAADAVKASPIQMGGRRVYIEHKRSKSGASGGGRRAEHFGRSLGRNHLHNGSINNQ
ncbi:nuclear transport factor 2-like [Henckelia pumila]|uniref:nuclear transport factor 2-like n=1 Tax=Henckelia pumila TaxID=405737 RepID=UPI003C6E4975